MRKAQALSDSSETLGQEDVFFNCEGGRLKLRSLDSGESFLILYQRADQLGPKTSDYQIRPMSDPAAVRKLLAFALGEKAAVRKKRIVFHAGQTRIHFDDVEGLGRFVELEVVLKPEQSEAEGREIADKIMGRLNIREGDLVGGAYVDLLSRKENKEYDSPSMGEGWGGGRMPKLHESYERYNIDSLCLNS